VRLLFGWIEEEPRGGAGRRTPRRKRKCAGEALSIGKTGDLLELLRRERGEQTCSGKEAVYRDPALDLALQIPLD